MHKGTFIKDVQFFLQFLEISTYLCPVHYIVSIHVLCPIFLDIPTYPKIGHPKQGCWEGTDYAHHIITYHQVPKFEKTSKMQKKTIFLLRNASCNQRGTLLVYFLSILNICFIEDIFWTKTWPLK